MAIIINTKTEGVYVRDSAYYYDGDILDFDDPSGIIIDIPGKFFVSGNIVTNYNIAIFCGELNVCCIFAFGYLFAVGSVIAQRSVNVGRDIRIERLLSASVLIQSVHGNITADAINTEGTLKGGEIRTTSRRSYITAGIKNPRRGYITADRIEARYGVNARGALFVRGDVVAGGDVMMDFCHVHGTIHTPRSITVVWGSVTSCREVRAPKVVLCSVDTL